MNPRYQLTEEQASDLCKSIRDNHPDSYAIPANEWLNANIPPPIAGLRPFEEMPAEVPEGHVRVYGYLTRANKWHVEAHKSANETHAVDIQVPPLDPEAALRREFEEWWVKTYPGEAILWHKSHVKDMFIAYQAGKGAKP